MLCFLLDTLFDGRPIARFWFLEKVARVPYFAYISAHDPRLEVDHHTSDTSVSISSSDHHFCQIHNREYFKMWAQGIDSYAKVSGPSSGFSRTANRGFYNRPDKNQYFFNIISSNEISPCGTQFADTGFVTSQISTKLIEHAILRVHNSQECRLC